MALDLADHFAIRDLYARAVQLFDRGDTAWVDYWAEEPEFFFPPDPATNFPGITLSSHEALTGMVRQAHGMMEASALYFAIAFVGLATYLTLREAPRITDRIGRIGMNVISRLMGLVLATMSAQFIIDGLSAALPGLTLAK